MFDSETPQEIWQPVQPGDATALRDGNSLSVQALELGTRVLGALDLAGGVFTPNGDGVNDGLDIAYDLLKLVAPTPVVVEVRDLAGGLVREVYNGLEHGRSPPAAVERFGRARAAGGSRCLHLPRRGLH